MQNSPQLNKAKPPLPRKPRTVYASNRTGPAIPPKPRPPPTSKKLPGLLKKTENSVLTKNVQPEFSSSAPVTEKPKPPSALLKRFYSTEDPHPLAKKFTGNGVTTKEPLELPKSPSKDNHPHSKDFTDHVVRRDRERVTDRNLEKSLLKSKIASKQTASGPSLGLERPTSMIIASPVSICVISKNVCQYELFHLHSHSVLFMIGLSKCFADFVSM